MHILRLCGSYMREEQAISPIKNTLRLVCFCVNFNNNYTSVEIDGATQTNLVGWIIVIAWLLAIYGNPCHCAINFIYMYNNQREAEREIEREREREGGREGKH